MRNVDLKLVIAVARMHNSLFGNIDKSLKPYNLSVSEFGVLEFLYHKGKQPIQEIAEKILVTSGTITYIIDRLSQKGYVIRRKCEVDKRKYYVELTNSGLTLIVKLFPEHEKYLEKTFGGFNNNDKVALINLLNELKQTIEKVE